MYENEIESGKDYGRFYMGDSGRTGFEVGAEGFAILENGVQSRRRSWRR